MLDSRQRPLRSLRLSVTDRCNLRCSYCMPEAEYTWLPKDELLDFEELVRLARVFCTVGVDRVRITGGEPLLRRDLPILVERLRLVPGLRDMALTTNGTKLRQMAAPLRRAGLDRLTVSLDTLREGLFEELTRTRGLNLVLDGIAAAKSAGFDELKMDAVVLRGANDDELIDLLDFGKREGLEVRFIEYMDVGGATRWKPELVVTRAEILATIERAYGAPRAVEGRGSAPAERFELPDGTIFGVIASTTAPFCGACDRSRLTADGMWLHCLYAASGFDLKAPLRAGASDDAMRELVTRCWAERSDRGAELRAASPHRPALIPAAALRNNPHLEMHTRGG